MIACAASVPLAASIVAGLVLYFCVVRPVLLRGGLLSEV